MYIICLVFSLYYVSSSDNHLLLKQTSRIPAILFSIALILFIGYRPISGRFQDMMAYAHQFERSVTPNFAGIHWDGEWGLELLMNVCKESGRILYWVFYFAFQHFHFGGLPRMEFVMVWHVVLHLSEFAK